LNTDFSSFIRLRHNGLGKCRNLGHIRGMKKARPEMTASAPLAKAAPQPRFTEHRPETNAPIAAANSAEIAAETKPDATPAAPAKKSPKEIGGPKGPEPTRYGDWERDGRCVDF